LGYLTIYLFYVNNLKITDDLHCCKNYLKVLVSKERNEEFHH
jgi:ribosome-binding factor A